MTFFPKSDDLCFVRDNDNDWPDPMCGVNVGCYRAPERQPQGAQTALGGALCAVAYRATANSRTIRAKLYAVRER